MLFFQIEQGALPHAAHYLPEKQDQYAEKRGKSGAFPLLAMLAEGYSASMKTSAASFAKKGGGS
jgi:hypothetical protein